MAAHPLAYPSALGLILFALQVCTPVPWNMFELDSSSWPWNPSWRISDISAGDLWLVAAMFWRLWAGVPVDYLSVGRGFFFTILGECGLSWPFLYKSGFGNSPENFLAQLLLSGSRGPLTPTPMPSSATNKALTLLVAPFFLFLLVLRKILSYIWYVCLSWHIVCLYFSYIFCLV